MEVAITSRAELNLVDLNSVGFVCATGKIILVMLTTATSSMSPNKEKFQKLDLLLSATFTSTIGIAAICRVSDSRLNL
jgi:hypothetical protein